VALSLPLLVIRPFATFMVVSMALTDRILHSDYGRLLTSSEMLEWAERGLQPSVGGRMFYLTVYRWNVEIAKTTVGPLNITTLSESLRILDLQFSEIPNGLRFALTSWRRTPGDFIQSVTNVGSVISKVLKFSTRGLEVVLSVSVRNYSRIVNSINESERRLRWKTQLSSTLSAISKVKTLRKNPELDNYTSTTVTTTPVTKVTTSQEAARYSRTYSSVRTPGFSKLSKEGNLPMNNYALNRLEIRPGPYTDLRAHVNGIDFVKSEVDKNVYLTSALVPANHIAMDENLTVLKLASKVNPARTNLAESFSQATLMGKTVADNISRLADLVRIIHGKRPRGLVKVLGKKKAVSFGKGLTLLKKGGLSGSELLAQLWLEYRYAWLPLIGDVDSSLKAYARYHEQHPLVSKVTATSRKRSTTYQEIAFFTYSDGTQAVRKFYSANTTVLRFGVEYGLDSIALNVLSGLGFTSPASLAWELTPFSFVVDWALPIGPALEAFSAFEGLVFRKGYKTYFTRREIRMAIESSGDVPSQHCSFRGWSDATRILVDRTALSAFPGSRVPSFKSPFSLIHAANAAALLTKLLLRK